MHIILIASVLCGIANSADSSPDVNKYVTSYGKYNAEGLSVGQVIINVHTMFKGEVFRRFVQEKSKDGKLVTRYEDESKNVMKTVFKNATIDPLVAAKYAEASVLRLRYQPKYESSALYALLELAKNVAIIPQIRRQFSEGVGFEDLMIKAEDKDVADLLEKCIDSYIHNFISKCLKLLEIKNYYEQEIAAIKAFYAALPEMPTKETPLFLPKEEEEAAPQDDGIAVVVLSVLFLSSIAAIIVLTILLIKKIRANAAGRA